MTVERLASLVMAVQISMTATDIRKVIIAFRDALRSHQAVVNRLNVYPVPDGDTGTNMALTLEAVCRELDTLDMDADMAEVGFAISHGSLMGARGNSGVILSQLLRGIAERISPLVSIGPKDVVDALVSASELAYQAVVRPVEGTILTVARAAGQGALDAFEGSHIFADRANPQSGDQDTQGPDESTPSLITVVELARDSAARALESTPELLEVLARAGVVDAGGTGYLLLFDAFLHVIDGRPLPMPPEQAMLTAGFDSDIANAHALGDSVEESGSSLRYEVMYLLQAPEEAIPDFKEVWSGIGDSIVVVGGQGLWNCHIHTDDIGAAIEAALDAGRPNRIRITDLHDQVEEERWVREHQPTSGLEPEDFVGASRESEVVAVVAGDGIARIFRSLGVRHFVIGGQSMNPSTAEILEVVEASGSEQVIILPNNKNIKAVAFKVDELTSKTVRVVPTTSIVEGFAALLAYDPEAIADDNVASMTASFGQVIPAEVTQAVRDAHTDAGIVQEGDWMGISHDKVLCVADSAELAVMSVLAELIEEGHELITLIEGEGATAANTRRISEWLHDQYPAIGLEVHRGGQELYPYFIGIE